jgi:quercetin dioxygenase-like cupin family protein
MTRIDALAAAKLAVATRLDRPAMAIVHDSAEVRLVVFRLEPGQVVAPHRSTSSVQLTVLEGEGILSGESEEQSCGAGDVVVYAPRELHGMRASDGELLLLATITPRPGDAHS